VIIANSNLVPHWATQEHFDELAAKGLIMYGQMTAGSWIYIGTQGILQGTYETFAECARQHFGGIAQGHALRHRRVRRHGRRAAAGGHDERRHVPARGDVHRALEKRVHDRYLDVIERDLDAAIEGAGGEGEEGEAISIGWLGNICDLLDALIERGITPET
jgi:urocanate hydratase